LTLWLVLLLGLPGSPAGADGWTERGAVLRATALAEQPRGFVQQYEQALGLLLSGELPRERIENLLDRLAKQLPEVLQRWEGYGRPHGRAFPYMAAMAFVAAAEPHLPAGHLRLHPGLRTALAGHAPRAILVAPASDPRGRGGTLNQRLLTATAGYLYGEIFADEAERAFARAWLVDAAAWLFGRSHWEDGAPVYQAIYYQAFHLLHDHARDEAIRALAARVLDGLYARDAHRWLEGRHVAATTRANVALTESLRDVPVAQFLDLAFGAPTGPAPGSVRGAVIGATGSSYRPPAWVTAIARDPAPLTFTESFGLYPYDVARSRSLLFRTRLSYREEGLALSSFLDSEASRRFAQGTVLRGRSWLLAWPGRGTPSLLFLSPPHADPKPFAAGPATFLTSSDEWLLQDRGTLLGVFGGRKQGFQGLHGPFPEPALVEWRMAGTWLVARTERHLIGLWTAHPLTVDRRSDNAVEGAFPVLESRGWSNALILETMPIASLSCRPQDCLDRWAELLRSESEITFDAEGSVPRLRYRSHRGDRYALVFEGERTINGVAVEPDLMPLLQSRWVHQDRDGAMLTVTGHAALALPPLPSQ
jgi:hypothetical protein